MPRDELTAHVPRALIRYTATWADGSPWRAVLLRDVETYVATEKISRTGATGRSAVIGEDLVYRVKGRLDLRCLRAVEDLRMERFGIIEISSEDEEQCSISRFGASSVVTWAVSTRPGGDGPAETSLRFEVRQPTIVVPVQSRDVRSDGTADHVYADLLEAEEVESDRWLHGIAVASKLGITDDALTQVSIDPQSMEMLLLSKAHGIAKVVSALDHERWGRALSWVLSEVEISVAEFGAGLT